jgi:ABC-type polysaccharide/polyol phosphate export permease
VTSVREYSDVEYVFEPHSASTPNLREYFQALVSRRAFMVALAKADLRSARSNKALGNLWSVLDPMFQAAIYYFLYTVLRSGAARVEFLPVLIGDIFLFGLVSQAFSDAGSSVTRSKGLMLSSTFPRALLPATAIYKSLRSFVPIACTYVVLFPLVGGTLGFGVFVLPLLFAAHVMLMMGIALLVSTFTVLYKDATNLVSYVLRVLFFATPLIYPVEILPGTARKLISWQPLFGLFSGYQRVFSGGVPSAWMVLHALVWAVVLLVLGGRVFLRHEREFTSHL